MNEDLINLLPNKHKDWFINLKTLWAETLKIYQSLSEEQGLFKYELDKYSLKEILNHLTECEKMFNYHALLFYKNNSLELPQLDEKVFISNENANEQSFPMLIEAFTLSRLSTLYFLNKIAESKLNHKTYAYEYLIEYFSEQIATHNSHHLKIIKERYLPLL